jgi:hypothetical protein
MAVWAQHHGLDCRTCTEFYQKVRGCKEDVREMEIEGFKTKRCPMSYCGMVEAFYMQCYREYRAGFLPEPGGWLDQTVRFVTIISLIERLSLKYQEEKHGDART